MILENLNVEIALVGNKKWLGSCNDFTNSGPAAKLPHIDAFRAPGAGMRGVGDTKQSDLLCTDRCAQVRDP